MGSDRIAKPKATKEADHRALAIKATHRPMGLDRSNKPEAAGEIVGFVGRDKNSWTPSQRGEEISQRLRRMEDSLIMRWCRERRNTMLKRTVSAGLLLSIAALISLSGAVLKAQQKEITIRNVTNETVQYRLKPVRSSEEPTEHAIKIDTIDRYPGEDPLTVYFERPDGTQSYVLDPGMPYSFRYDENGDLELYEGSHGRTDAVDLAPYVPTPPAVVERMLEMAKVDKDDMVYDLGCGDGRIVIMAAVKYGAHGVGIDLDPQRIEESNINAKAAGVDKLVSFRVEDVTQSDISAATVVTMYLLTESNELMRPSLEKQLEKGMYVVTHNYRIPGWELKLVEEAEIKGEDGGLHNIYAYIR
jgi:SAM-dependent methyltransferase